MDINLFRGLMTALLLVLFIGVWVWAWLPSRKRDFDEAARLPLNDEPGRVQRDAPTGDDQ